MSISLIRESKILYLIIKTIAFNLCILISSTIRLLNHVSTDDFVDYWKENECYRALLANKYFR